MNMAKYGSFFIITLVLQLILFFVIKKDTGMTIIDMVVMSLLLAIFSFILDKVLRKGKSA